MFSEGQDFKSGFVTLVGRPNAGKSTLLNAVMGDKIAITSPTAQTTRHRLRAIYDRDDAQVIMVDTPGIHKPHDSLGEELNRSALKSLEDVDVVAYALDASAPLGSGDLWVLEHIKKARCPRILVVTKADLVEHAACEEQIKKTTDHLSFDDVVVCSAETGFNIEGFVNAVIEQLPCGPRWFPEGTRTDQPLDVLVAEFIREKILMTTHDEVPHAVGVQVEDLSYNKKQDVNSIMAVVYVERDSQKGILIGKGGAQIKKIGTQARHDLERLMGSRVYLDLRVKVKKNWRKDASQIRRFGYGEGL